MSDTEVAFENALQEGNNHVESFSELISKLLDETQYLGMSKGFNRSFSQKLRSASNYLHTLRQSSDKLHYYASKHSNNVHFIDQAKKFDNIIRRGSDLLIDLENKSKQKDAEFTTHMNNASQAALEKKGTEEYKKKFAGMSRKEISASLDAMKKPKTVFQRMFGSGGAMVSPSQGGVSIAPKGSNEMEREAYALVDKVDKLHATFLYTKHLFFDDPSGTEEENRNVIKKMYKIGDDAFEIIAAFNDLIEKGFTKIEDYQLNRRVKHATTELNQIMNEVMAISKKYYGDDDDEDE